MLQTFLRSLLAAARRSMRRRLDQLRGVAMQPDLSIVVCSVDDRRFTQCRANWRERLGDRRYELIRIADAKSLAEGYNRGLKRSRGDLLVFCHDDIEILQQDIYTRIVDHLASADLVGVAGTSRLRDGNWAAAGQPNIHGQVVQPTPAGGLTLDVFGLVGRPTGKPIQALDGVWLAVRRNVVESLRFDAERFDGFHLYDIDFTYRAYLAGYRLAVCHDILIYHQSLGQRDEAWQRYLNVFQRKYAEQLSREPVGEQYCMQYSVHDKAEALALFRNLTQSQGGVPTGG